MLHKKQNTLNSPQRCNLGSETRLHPAQPQCKIVSMPDLRFVSRSSSLWNENRPHILVVACSDGRLQLAVDEFLDTNLGVTSYDRLLLPGGPGALAASGVEHVRANAHKNEMKFLLDVHEIEEVILLFHGPALGGPDLALCADYARALGTRDREKVMAAQREDFAELKKFFESHTAIKLQAYRAQVDADHRVEFVEMDVPKTVFTV